LFPVWIEKLPSWFGYDFTTFGRKLLSYLNYTISEVINLREMWKLLVSLFLLLHSEIAVTGNWKLCIASPAYPEYLLQFRFGTSSESYIIMSETLWLSFALMFRRRLGH
jgi:hypothetical protein